MVKPGENELLVGVRDKSGYDVGGFAPYPWGSFWRGHRRGIWQDVYIIARPQVYIDDVFVQTSYRSLRLKVTLWVTNKLGETQDLDVNLNIIDKEGKEVPLPISPRKLVVRGGERKDLQFSLPWDNPHLWSPEDPYLYTLIVGIRNPSLNDDLRLCFGGREFWIEGNAFYLNGRRIKLRGDAWHYMGIPYQTREYARLWFRMAKETGLNHIRLHAQVYPSFYLDIADEEGILITDESAIWVAICNFLYNDDFWRRAKEHIREFVLRDRNHPSVIIWSATNEIMAAHRVNPNDPAPFLSWLFSKIHELVRKIKSLDGTPPVTSDGDEDLGGRGEIFSLHYPGPDLPNTSKPITIGESGSMFYSTPPEVAPTGGESVYLSFDNRLKGVGEELRDLIPNYRKWAQQVTPFNVVWYSLQPLPISRQLTYQDLETPGVKPERWGPFCSTLNPGYDLSCPPYKPHAFYPYIKALLQPLTFFPSERNSTFFGGENIKRSFIVFNDLPQNSSSFTLPEVREKEVLDMKITLWKENKGWQKYKEEDHKLSLFPPKLNPSFVPSLLGDPSRFPFSLEVLSDINSLQPENVLIVARQLTSQEASVLLKKIEEGCRAPILESSPPLLQALKLSRNSYSARRSFAPFEHPLLKGIEERELSFWRGGKVANGGYTPPVWGTIRPIIFCGAGDVCLLAIKRGKGTLILSEMDILNQMKEEPMAMVLLSNSLEYLHSLGENSYRKVGLLTSPSFPLRRILDAFGVDARPLKEADLPDVDVVIATGKNLPSPSSLKEFLQGGGTLLLLRPSPDDEKILNQVLPSTLKIIPYRGEVQLVRGTNEGLVQGLYLDWLFWLEKNRQIPSLAIRRNQTPPHHPSHRLAEMVLERRECEDRRHTQSGNREEHPAPQMCPWGGGGR